MRLQNHIPPPIGIPPPDVEMIQAPPPQYGWAQPPSYQGNGAYNHWPRHSPVTQVSNHISHMNGNGPPRLPSVVHSPNSHRASMTPQSPHMNGAYVPHMTNGYPPRSPASMHMPNGNYPPYTSPRPGPHHLTNGGPPPRANDHPPYVPHHHIHRPSYLPAQSPPLLNNPLQSRENGATYQPTNGHQENGRVNGGASASPSLRNLLS